MDRRLRRHGQAAHHPRAGPPLQDDVLRRARPARGLAYEAFKAFEDEINKKRGNLKVNVVFFPTTREKMVPDLLAGLGDVVVAGFTITPERDKLVDFAIPRRPSRSARSS